MKVHLVVELTTCILPLMVQHISSIKRSLVTRPRTGQHHLAATLLLLGRSLLELPKSCNYISQLLVRSLQRHILPVTMEMPDPLTLSTARSDDVIVDCSSGSDDLPGWPICDTSVDPTVASDRGGMLLYLNKALTLLRTAPHLLNWAFEVMKVESQSSRRRLKDRQTVSALYLRRKLTTQLNEESTFMKQISLTSPTIRLKHRSHINRCEKPASPVIVPVINIDDIEIGAQMTVQSMRTARARTSCI